MRKICLKSSVPGRQSLIAALAIFAAVSAFSMGAHAATKEIALAPPNLALKFCQSGKMKTNNIDYIAGTGGFAQFGPGYDCVQQVPTGTTITTAMSAVGKKVKECKLANAKSAILFCEDGGMGEYDIAYISGKINHTISGPGYGCSVGYSTSSIGNALCK